jgi:predicted transcriptional regulator
LSLIILLSIKPKYAEEILSCYKEYELRRGVVFRKGCRIVLYASTPLRAIIGEFTAGRVLTGEPDEIVEFIRATGPRGVTEEDISYIAEERCRVSAIEVINPVKYRHAITLGELRMHGLRNPPRSYLVLRLEHPVHAKILSFSMVYLGSSFLATRLAQYRRTFTSY